MDTYELMSGETLDLGNLAAEERRFLQQLAQDAAEGYDYFDLLRRVKGPGALPLRGGPITSVVAASALYRAAHDVADRAGIRQGYLLAPETERPARMADLVGGLLSLTEAAELIGITRPATHQALVEGRLRGQRVGNAWVVAKADAEEFRRSRPGSTKAASRESRA